MFQKEDINNEILHKCPYVVMYVSVPSKPHTQQCIHMYLFRNSRKHNVIATFCLVQVHIGTH